MKLKMTLMATALLACSSIAWAQNQPAAQQPAVSGPQGNVMVTPGTMNPVAQPATVNPQNVGQPAPLPSNQANQQAPRSLPPLPAQGPAGSGVAGTPQTFEDVMNATFGMSTDQIRQLRKQSDDRQRAAATAPSAQPPKPVTSQIVASPAPGSTAPVVRLFPGFATSLIITDSTGQPWPIENFTVGEKDKFEVKRLDQGNGSALSVVPLAYYGQSNLILFLKGLPTPIAISFLAGQKEVDFRVDVRVVGRGPNSQISMTGLPEAANTQLLSLLEGVAPSDSKVLKTSSSEVQAWMGKSGRMFVRTNQSIISPLWFGSVRSADGTNVYEMKAVGSLLLLRNNDIETVNVSGW